MKISSSFDINSGIAASRLISLAAGEAWGFFLGRFCHFLLLFVCNLHHDLNAVTQLKEPGYLWNAVIIENTRSLELGKMDVWGFRIEISPMQSSTFVLWRTEKCVCVFSALNCPVQQEAEHVWWRLHDWNLSQRTPPTDFFYSANPGICMAAPIEFHLVGLGGDSRSALRLVEARRPCEAGTVTQVHARNT